jgi:TatD DNase family protein
MIDSHCHLGDKQFEKDLAAVLRRAREAGVERCIAIADTFEEGERCLEISAKYEEVFCTLGVHPHMAKTWEEGDLERLQKMIDSSDKVKAVGEIGLDYYYDNSPRDVQQQVFRTQLELAKKLSLPAVVHCRDAVDDIQKIITEVEPPSLVVHCCTEKWEDMAPLVERGYYLSFTGIATYTNSEEIRRTIKQCPLEQIMIETDAPYLAPVPYRGKRNEPAYVMEVAKLLANLKGLSLDELNVITTETTVAFFGLPA